MQNEFEKYILTHHPDPDTILMQDNHGEGGRLRVGYERSQIILLAEIFAEEKIKNELLAFKQFISRTPLNEQAYYSDEEFTNLYINTN